MITTIVHIYVEYNNTEKSVIAEIQTFQKALYPSMTSMLWNADTTSLQNLINGTLHATGIVGVSIFTPDLGRIDAGETLKNIPVAAKEGIYYHEDGNFFWYSFPFKGVDMKGDISFLGTGAIFSKKSEIFRQVRPSVYMILINAILKSFALWIIFLWQGKRVISKPLGELTNALSALDFNNIKHKTLNIKSSSKDEIQFLVTSYETMIDNLAQAKDEIDDLTKNLEDKVQQRTKQLNQVNKQIIEKNSKLEEKNNQIKQMQKVAIDQAHKAGMAEMSTGILHEIGNMVNSLSISLEQVGSHNSELKQLQTKLEKAVPLLQDENAPKEKVIDYLTKLSELFQTLHTSILKEVSFLMTRSDLIKQAVTTQQSYARNRHMSERISLDLVVKECISLQQSSLKKHNITIKMHYGNVPPLDLQKNKLMHIIMNLLRNSTEALDEVKDRDRIITVGTEVPKDPDVKGRIFVQDNGPGISDQNTVKIFEYGFTTKNTGHGFGMHFCANAMKELNGNIAIDQSYEGPGVRFIMEFY